MGFLPDIYIPEAEFGKVAGGPSERKPIVQRRAYRGIPLLLQGNGSPTTGDNAPSPQDHVTEGKKDMNQVGGNKDNTSKGNKEADEADEGAAEDGEFSEVNMVRGLHPCDGERHYESRKRAYNWIDPTSSKNDGGSKGIKARTHRERSKLHRKSSFERWQSSADLVSTLDTEHPPEHKRSRVHL